MNDTNQTNTSLRPAALTVLYDGACPLCRREIAVYRDLQPLQPGSPVCFADISNTAVPLPAGTSREQLLARFHVQGRDGQLLGGAQAFLALWAALPGWRWLALAGRLPGAGWVMERMYRLFLRWRPMLQRWAARLDYYPQATSHDARAACWKTQRQIAFRFEGQACELGKPPLEK